MQIENIEVSAPSKVNPIGTIGFTALIPVLFEEGTPELVDFEGDVNISEETTSLLKQAAASMMRDLAKK